MELFHLKIKTSFYKLISPNAICNNFFFLNSSNFRFPDFENFPLSGKILNIPIQYLPPNISFQFSVFNEVKPAYRTMMGPVFKLSEFWINGFGGGI